MNQEPERGADEQKQLVVKEEQETLQLLDALNTDTSNTVDHK